MEESIKVPQNFQVELPYGPVISLLEIYPEEIKTKILKKYQHSVFFAALFIITGM